MKINIIVKRNPEDIANKLENFIINLKGKFDYEVAGGTGSVYGTIFNEKEDDEIEIRISDHTKPFFGKVEKMEKAGVMWENKELEYIQVAGTKEAKKIIYNFLKN